MIASLIATCLLAVQLLNSGHATAQLDYVQPESKAQPKLNTYTDARSNQQCIAWVDSVLNTLSTEERVAQLFIYTIEPSDAKPNMDLLNKVVTHYKVGGLLFSGGMADKQAMLTNKAQELAKVPLLITFDGEWGLSMRLKNTPKFPRNMVLGCITDNALLYEYGTEMARQCKEMGVQVNFAPVADVNINPRNPVINTRSFGESPQLVAQKVVAYSKGLEHGGVLSVSKHFPGHGDTNVDSHKALPTLPFTKARLDSVELFPFKQVIKNNLGGIMVGHLCVPAIEPTAGLPSSLSKKIVQDLLIDSMGFEGLIFTDALVMKGTAGQGNVCLKALQAGNDMVLTPPSIKREIDAIMSAIKQGTISEESITKKCRKVLTYKYMLGLSTTPQIELAGLTQRINTPESYDLIARLEMAAITVLKNKDGLLPLQKNKEKEVAIVTTGDSKKLQPFIDKLNEYVKTKVVTLRKEMNEAERNVMLNSLSNSSSVLIAINDTKPAAYQTLINAITAKKASTLLFFTPQKPMIQLAKAIESANAVILAHSDSKAVQAQCAAIIMGYAKANGRLSAGVGKLFKRGDGITLQPLSVAPWQSDEVSATLAQSTLRMTMPALRVVEPTATVQMPFFPKTDVDAKLFKKLAAIDTIALEGIKKGAYPGCQIVVLKDGKALYDKSFGTHNGNNKLKVHDTDLYDVASLTKTSATLLALMKLYDEKRFKLTDRVSQHLPWLKNSNKANITIQELLYHQSGLPASISFFIDLIDKTSYNGNLFGAKRSSNHSVFLGRNTWGNPGFNFQEGMTSPIATDHHTIQICDSLWLDQSFTAQMRKKIIDAPLLSKRYRYSDIGFLLLQNIVEELSDMPLDQYLTINFYQPMGLQRTGFLPLERVPKEEIVPSSYDNFYRKHVIEGFVHDESAALQGGVAGSAGLFSTAEEIAAIYQMYLDGGVWNGKRYLSEETVKRFTTSKSSISRRGLGFDKPDMKNPKGNPCADSAPKSVFGHTGFTGTCAWVDPQEKLVYVFISNRTYPDARNNKFLTLSIRPRIQQAIYDAIKK